jgi:hypothetical protein
MRIGGGLFTLDQIIGGTLNSGIVPRERLSARRVGRKTSYQVDDFLGGSLTTGQIGSLGWLLSVTGSGALANVAGAANYPGKKQLQCGGTVASWSQIYLGTVANPPVFSGDLFDLTFVFNSPGAANAYDMIVGLVDTLSTATPANGIFFTARQADNAFAFVCRTGGVETKTFNGMVLDNNPHSVRIQLQDNGVVLFTYDDNTVIPIGTNVPTTPLAPTFGVGNSGAFVNNAMGLDYFDLEMTISR